MGNAPAYTGPPPMQQPAPVGPVVYNKAGKPLAQPARQVAPPAYAPAPPAGTYNSPAYARPVIPGAPRPMAPTYVTRPMTGPPPPQVLAAPTYLAQRPGMYGATPMQRAPAYQYPAPMAAAAALDAADGVIDGRFYGNQIGIQAPQFAAPAPTYLAPQMALSAPSPPQLRYMPFAPTYAAQPMQAVTHAPVSPFPMAPTYASPHMLPAAFSAPFAQPATAYATPSLQSYYATTPAVIHNASALALDAADGQLDGRFFGLPLVQQSFTPGQPSSAAFALDAADGQLDGRYFGAPIVQNYASSVMAQPMGIPNSAFLLDAADGRLDGSYFGAPIVQTGMSSALPAYNTSVLAPSPVTDFSASQFYSPQSFAPAPAYGMGFPQAPAYGTGFPQAPAYAMGFPQAPTMMYA